MTPARFRGRNAARRHARGFTLLEVIVAFALLGVALTLLLGAISGAARQVSGSQDASRASLYAQSLLADAGLGQPLEPGQSEGSFENGRYRWVLQVKEYTEPTTDSAVSNPAGSMPLLDLTLDMRWGSEAGQALQWRTLRLVSGESGQ